MTLGSYLTSCPGLVNMNCTVDLPGKLFKESTDAWVPQSLEVGPRHHYT